MNKKAKIKIIDRSDVLYVLNQIPFTAFFGCTFTKKDHTIRKMNCNRSISHTLKYSRKPSLITTSVINVFDVNADNGKGGYRYVNLETLSEIRANGVIYKIR
jgi:hypothetical protein